MMESYSIKRPARSDSALRRTAITAADFYLSGLLTICRPALRRFAISRGQLPRASASADDAQISIIHHHYYSPAVNPRDLLFALDSPRSLPGIKLDVELHRSFSTVSISAMNFAPFRWINHLQPVTATATVFSKVAMLKSCMAS